MHRPVEPAGILGNWLSRRFPLSDKQLTELRSDRDVRKSRRPRTINSLADHFLRSRLHRSYPARDGGGQFADNFRVDDDPQRGALALEVVTVMAIYEDRAAEEWRGLARL